MCRLILRIWAALSVAAAGLALTPAPVEAQQRTGPGAITLPNSPFPPSFYGYSSSYYGPYYLGQYQYGNVDPRVYNNYSSQERPTFTPPSPPVENSRGYPRPSYSYPNYLRLPSNGAPPAEPRPAPRGQDMNRFFRPTAPSESRQEETVVHMSVHVPTPDAEVWVEGQKTTSEGSWRQFQSPPLRPGVEYIYQLRARWLENGREVTQTREVPVRARQGIMVDFTSSPPME